MALQEKTYSYGSLAWKSESNAYVLDLVVKEEAVDLAANTSQISYMLQLRSGPNNRFTDNINCGVTVDGETKTANVDISAVYNKTYPLLSGTKTVSHDADGTRDLTVTGSIWGVSDNRYAPPDMTVSGTMVLTSIPRASTIGATDADIGSISMVAVSRKSVSYTHSIAYRFGSLTGYMQEDGSTSQEEIKLTAANIPFRVPDAFCAQVPNAKSGICTLTCTTYSGSTQIGQPQTASFTAKVNQDQNLPQVSGTVTDINPETIALTGNDRVLVRYQSTARCEVSAQGTNGASIAQYTVNGKTVTSILELSHVEDDTFLFRAQDSRGYWGSCPVDAAVIPYVPLTCNASISRPEPTGDRILLTISKSNFFSGSFGAVDNALSVSYEGGGQSGTIEPVLGEDSYTAQLELAGFPYNETGTITVTVSDALMTLEIPLTVMRGLPVFDWSHSDFRFHVPVTAPSFNGDTDRVVACGTTGIWRWRKWASGLGECWARVRETISFPGTWGSLFTSGDENAEKLNKVYPFSFKQVPALTVSLDQGGNAGGFLMVGGAAGRISPSETQTGSFEICRGTETTSGIFTINYYAAGQV